MGHALLDEDMLMRCRRPMICKTCGRIEFFYFAIGNSGWPNWVWTGQLGDNCPCGSGDYRSENPERCTGFKDAAGDWVYENDIVNVGDNFNSEIRFGYGEGTVCFHLQEREICERAGDTGKRTHMLTAYTSVPEHWKIIGHVLDREPVDPDYWGEEDDDV
jgi:hypothetical protein